MERLYIVSDEEVADYLIKRGIPATYWGNRWKDLLEHAGELKTFPGEVLLLVPPDELRLSLAALKRLPINVAVAVPLEDIQVGPGFTKVGPVDILPEVFSTKFILIRRKSLRLSDFLRR